MNSARVKNDFVDRVVESRRLLEKELRDHLRELATSAERALQSARQARAAGAQAVTAELGRFEALRAQIKAVAFPGQAQEARGRSA